jgi:hypothetical protein
LRIGLQRLFQHVFSLCRSPIVHEHSGIAGQLSPYVGLGSLGTRLHRECNAMGDVAKATPHIPSTSAQNGILSLPIIHIITSCQIYVAIDNASLVPYVSFLTICCYPWNSVRAADDLSHAETGKATSTGGCLTWTNFQTGSKLPEFPGIVASAVANQYSMKAPSLFWSLILNSRCTCHGKRPFNST